MDPSLLRTIVPSRRLLLASAGLLALVGMFALLTSPSAKPMSPPAYPRIWYVNDNATGQNNGSSWADALNYLHSALEDPTLAPGDEIWIAEGQYHTHGVNGFVISKSIKIYGAFNGTENSVAGRLGLAANTILDGFIYPTPPPTYPQQSQHVVKVTGVVGNPGVLLDSFVIRNGNGYPTSTKGGGVYAINSDLDMRDCTVRDNLATTDGGGLFFEGGATFNTLNLVSCLFEANAATDNGGGLGGSLVNGEIVNTTFGENWTYTSHGAAMYLKTMGDSNVLTMTDCSFWNNQAGKFSALGEGGAIYLAESAPTTAGGANAKFVNCTMSDNRASACQAGQAISISAHSQSAIYNSILAYNGGACGTLNPIGGNSVVEYTDFWAPPQLLGINPVNGNKEADPGFRSHAAGGLTLVGGSLCIDAADFDRLPPDHFDLDGDGIGSLETIDLDLLFQKRLVDRVEGDTGHATGGVFTYLDMGAYEKP